MKPMRILVDSLADAGLPNAQMGNAREIVSRLDPACFHVTIFNLGEPDSRILNRENTRLIQLPRRKQTLPILSEFLWGSHEILFYLKSSPASRWYLRLRKKWRDRRTTIGTVESQSNLKQEPSVTPGAIRLWEETVLRCDHLFSNSASVRQSLQREYGLLSEIIPTGVNTRFFTPDWNRPRNARVTVLFAGSLRRFKQPDFVLAAAARFPQADFRIAGTGPLEAELALRINRENLTNAFLLGPLSQEQLRDEYRKADVFLFPSIWEGSPKVILEAAACGLPVVVRNDYMPETVCHRLTGYAAASNNEILSSLDMLIANPELRVRLGRAARTHSEKYDWDLITAQWSQRFLDLARHPQLRRAS
jgi:glycosyltransferase involved in cell wall biosynthesis